MLGIWRKGCINLSDYDHCPDCEFQGTGARKGCCDFDDAAMVKIFCSRPVQTDREKVLDITEILDSLCNIDLWQYVRGDKEGDDVGRCRGITCNYCGRYTAELRQGEPWPQNTPTPEASEHYDNWRIYASISGNYSVFTHNFVYLWFVISFIIRRWTQMTDEQLSRLIQNLWLMIICLVISLIGINFRIGALWPRTRNRNIYKLLRKNFSHWLNVHPKKNRISLHVIRHFVLPREPRIATLFLPPPSGRRFFPHQQICS